MRYRLQKHIEGDSYSGWENWLESDSITRLRVIVEEFYQRLRGKKVAYRIIDNDNNNAIIETF